MPNTLTDTPLSFRIRRSLRYLLVLHGFRFLQAVVILGVLSFVLTGSRIAVIDQLGNRADIVISVLITIMAIWFLTSMNRHVMGPIDRRFFREPLLRSSTGDAGYVTFFLAAFDRVTKRLTYVNAGHNPPMLVRRSVTTPRSADHFDQQKLRLATLRPAVVSISDPAVTVSEKAVISLLPTGGPIIGPFLNEPYEQETIQLQPGDTLVVYTDGVTEALNRAEMEFGDARLRSVLTESLEPSAQQVAQKIIDLVKEWQGPSPQHDDLTLIVMRVK